MRNEKISYVVVGAFVVAMVAALLVSVAVLTGRTGDTDPYYAVYGNVSGINPGTKVLYEGFMIGQVERVEPERIGNDIRFKVWMDIRKGWTIPADSTARISVSGLLSAVMIDIKRGTSTVFIEPGGEIAAAPGGNLFAVMSEVANEVANLSQTALRPLLANLDEQIGLVGTLLRERAPELMANLIAVSQDLAEKTPAITRDMQGFAAELNVAGGRVNQVLRDENLETIDASLANVERATTHFATVSADMAQTQRRLDQLLVSLEKVVRGNGDDVEASVRDLRQTMATISRSVSSISHDLEGAARNLNEFSRNIRRNPAQLLRSGAPDDRRR